MQTKRFLVTLLAAALLTGSGCGHDASFHGKEASPLSFDVVVLGDTLGAFVGALEAAAGGAAVALLYGEPGDDSWLLEQGAAVPIGEESAAGAGAIVETDQRFDARQTFVSGGDDRGRVWYPAAGADDALQWFAALMKTPLEQSRPGLLRLPQLSYAQAYVMLSREAGKRGVRLISDATVEAVEPAPTGEWFTLRVRIPGDRVKQVHSRTVILAQGGYLQDEVLMQEVAAGMRPAPWRNSGNGDALRLAIALNLDLVQLERFVCAPAVQVGGRWVKAYYPEQSLLIGEGQVQSLEGMTGTEIVTLLMQQGKEHTGWLVVAESRLSGKENGGLGWVLYPGIDSVPGAGSLDPALRRQWFGRSEERYYGAPIAALAEYCLGGIAVNEQGQVLRAGKHLAGIFALGEAAGGVHTQTLLPGAALSETLVWGRRVGVEAARLAQQ